MDSRRSSPNVVRSAALGIVAGQAGCGVVVLVVVGLAAGIWLDAQLGTRPALTIALMLLSIPVSLLYMVSSVLSTARALQKAAPPEEEEDNA